MNYNKIFENNKLWEKLKNEEKKAIKETYKFMNWDFDWEKIDEKNFLEHAELNTYMFKKFQDEFKDEYYDKLDKNLIKIMYTFQEYMLYSMLHFQLTYFNIKKIFSEDFNKKDILHRINHEIFRNKDIEINKIIEDMKSENDDN